jgi:hypothetical protein
MSWEALATGELADRLRASLTEILVALKAHRPVREDPWTALLYEYADRADNSGEHAAVATAIFERAVASLSELGDSTALYGGFPGVAWLASHITQTEADDEDPNAEIDATLHTLLARPWATYDLIGGLVGIGVYFLERLEVPGARAVSSTCLELIVERLTELGTFSSAGVAWFTPAAQLSGPELSRAPNGFFNLGVAHGIPGVIALLGQICGRNVGGSRARELLGRSVDWLLSQPHSNGPSRFSPWIAEGNDESRHGGSRLAWCYGDLGIAAALLLAARCVGEPRWEREAIELARAQGLRRDANTLVVDAGLCHGAAGAAHIFNRMYQATGDTSFKDAARYWLERTLDMRQPDVGIAGYRFLRGTAKSGPPVWEDTPGFLTGVAGVGLALLAATSDVEPTWDRVLLVPIPPQAR